MREVAWIDGGLRFRRLDEVSRFLRGLENVVGTRDLGMRVKTERRFVERRRCGKEGCCTRRCPR